MVLPPGINKATGMSAALDALELSPLNVIAIGDAENDHAFLTASGCSVAVANGLDAVKNTADLVTAADHGAGVVEVIDTLLADERPFAARAAARRKIALGQEDRAVLRPTDDGMLIAGSSGIGKSTLATAIMEKLAAQGFQICVLDPEGDYDDLRDAIVLGDGQRAPRRLRSDVLRKPAGGILVVKCWAFRCSSGRASSPASSRRSVSCATRRRGLTGWSSTRRIPCFRPIRRRRMPVCLFRPPSM